MNEREVHELSANGFFRREALNGRVEETHISWVILTSKYAFKIKKPLKLAFLDFSTVELRRHYCEREVLLNSRFSNIYLSIEHVSFTDGQWVIGEGAANPVDYCVVMKRMALAKRMDNRLRSGSVDENAIKILASEVATFHNKAEKIFTPFDLAAAFNTFNDLSMIEDFAAKNIGDYFRAIIVRAMEWSDQFLRAHANRIQQRIDHGLKRDVHGDLHSGNIFLYRHPVLFDCIEFNDQFRQIDVLYEVAFLCMDLEGYRQKHLSEKFLQEYKKHFSAFQAKEDHDLFVYFKCLRANIRAKVHAMSASQADNSTELTEHVDAAKKYLVLMNEYMANAKRPEPRTWR